MNATERLHARAAANAARCMSSRIRENVAMHGLANLTGEHDGPVAHLARLVVEVCLSLEAIAESVDGIALLGSKSKGLIRVPVGVLRPLARAGVPAAQVPAPEPEPVEVSAPPEPATQAPPPVRTRRLRAPDGELSGRLSVAEQQRIARSAAAEEPWERRARISVGRR